MYSICTGVTGLFTYWLTKCTLSVVHFMKHTYPSCSFQTSLLWLQLFCWISCCKAFHWELVTRDHSDKLVVLEVEILKFPEKQVFAINLSAWCHKFIITIIVSLDWNNLKITIDNVNPLHPNISMHILHTVLYTFPCRNVVTYRVNLFNNQEVFLVGDHFLYSHDLNTWFRGDIVRRN